MIMVPIFVVVMMLPFEPWSSIIGVALFIIASLTDMLDGKIARKYNLITDFGKFIDPLADKFMVIGALLVILYKYESIRPLFIWAVIIVIFRELAITSMRLVAASTDGSVIAAAYLGKLKTVTQMVFTSFAIIEPAFYGFGISFINNHVLSYVLMALMTIMTLWSGIDYLKSYWKYIKE